MNSKELFEKIKSSITEALNKEDGIMLGGKELTFHQHDELLDGKLDNVKHNCVEVHVLGSAMSKEIRYVNVYNVLYIESASIYAVEELKKTFSQERPLISRNFESTIKDGFQIAITFDENQIKDS